MWKGTSVPFKLEDIRTSELVGHLSAKPLEGRELSFGVAYTDSGERLMVITMDDGAGHVLACPITTRGGAESIIQGLSSVLEILDGGLPAIEAAPRCTVVDADGQKITEREAKALRAGPLRSTVVGTD